MTLTVPVHRRLALLVVLIAAALTLTGVTRPVDAAPGGADSPDDEGGTSTLRAQLDAASRGYLDAATALEQSRKRQQDLTTRLSTLQTDLNVQSATIEEMATTAYRTGRVGALSALVGSASPDGLFDRALALNAVAANENAELRQLIDLREQVVAAKTAIDTEVVRQEGHLAAMAARKKQAEQALAAAAAAAAASSSDDGGQESSGVPATGSRQARPAPRNPDGSWPPESCSVDDPTTSGCLTPRTLHALNQAKAAGFTRYVSCHRSGGGGEHPKGQACDFAAQANGFGGAATGGDRTYGNNLAAYFIANANRLGVLYVIWYRQIWLPSSGWRSYSGRGSPSAEHTNHVHLSVY